MSDKESKQNPFLGIDATNILQNIGGIGSFRGAYLDGKNLRLYPDSEGHGLVPRKVKGTVTLQWNAPAGENTAIGRFWDKKKNAAILFVKNEFGNDCIISVIGIETKTIFLPPDTLADTEIVSKAAMIDGKFSVWTDGKSFPKYLDIDRGYSEAKSVSRVYIPKGTGLTSRLLSASLLVNGVPSGLFIPMTPFTPREISDFSPMFRKLAAHINTSFPALTAKSCGEFVEVESPDPDTKVVVLMTDFIAGVGQTPITLVTEWISRYASLPPDPRVINLSKMAPMTPPSLSAVQDTKNKGNRIASKIWQFCIGFRLVGGEQTVTSPFSDVIGATNDCNSLSSKINTIVVNFDSTILNDAQTRTEIDIVEIYVRDATSEVWALAKSMQKAEWMYDREYRFTNLDTYTAADLGYVAATNTWVPPVAESFELISDTDDNQKVILGGITSGDENACVEVFAKPIFNIPISGGAETVTVRATIVIQAPFNAGAFEFGQPIGVYDGAAGIVFGGLGGSGSATLDPETWGQTCPLGGFAIYAAGTDLVAISSQEWLPTQFSCGFSNPTPWTVPVGSPATGRAIIDLTQLGASVSQCNETHRAAARNIIQGSGFYHTVELAGLERGKTYVLRMPSHRIDVLNDDSVFDINGPSRKWQGTSGRVFQFGDISVPGEIDPQIHECIVTVPLSGPTVIDIGTIKVLDATNPTFIEGSFILDGYLFDRLGTDHSASEDIRQLGERATSQLLAFRNYGISTNSGFAAGTYTTRNTYLDQVLNTYTVKSDHNGYFFFPMIAIALFSPRMTWLGVTGNPSSPSGTITGWTAGTVQVNDYQIANNINDQKWEGGLESATLTSVTGNLERSGWKEYIVANLNTTLSMRTRVRVSVSDSNNNPVENVPVVLSQGQVGITGPDGVAVIVAHGDSFINQNNRLGQVVVMKPSGCSTTFLTSDVDAVNINSFVAGGLWSESPQINHYIVALLFRIQSQSSERSFGRGGVFPVGYYLKRLDGSKTPVKPVTDLFIPLQTEDIGEAYPLDYPIGTFTPDLASIEWEIRSDVPTPWIGRWEYLQIVVGEDKSRSQVIQWAIPRVIYSSGWDAQNQVPFISAYGSTSASEVYIELTFSMTRYNETHTGASIGYLWAIGDMLRILTSSTGAWLEEVIEVPITGQRGEYIIFDDAVTIPELLGGEIIEIYSPGKPLDDSFDKYYDVPEGLVAIVDPYSATPTWSSTSGVIQNGQYWSLFTSVPIRPSTSQPWTTRPIPRLSFSKSDVYPSLAWGGGKESFEDPQAEVKQQGMLMWHSNTFKPGTKINGLNWFDLFSFREAEQVMGIIKGMEMLGNSMIVIATSGCFSVSIGQNRMEAGTDFTLVKATDVLGTINPISWRFGTHHPLSIVRTNSTVVWFDVLNAEMVQYDANGPGSISRFLRPRFKAKARTVGDDTKVSAAFYPDSDEILVCFPPHLFNNGTSIEEIEGETLGYYDPENHWVARWGFSHDVMVQTARNFYSFDEGRILMHNQDETAYNSIDGNILPLEITIVFNNLEGVESFKDLWIRSNTAGWDISEAFTYEGQQTYVTDAEFVLKEGTYRANMQRDMLAAKTGVDTTNLRVHGNQMRSNEIAITLRHAKNGYAELLSAVLHFIHSPNS